VAVGSVEHRQKWAGRGFDDYDSDNEEALAAHYQVFNYYT